MMGRKLSYAVPTKRINLTLQGDIYDWIKTMPDGGRSEFVNNVLLEKKNEQDRIGKNEDGKSEEAGFK
jgi:hypothetical protein